MEEYVFGSRNGLKDHKASPAHSTTKYDCPYKEDPVFQCSEVFDSEKAASRHVKKEHEEHEVVLYPCPGAEDYNCDRTFVEKSNATAHHRDVHLNVKKICTYCGKQVKNLAKHVKLHEQFPCPFSSAICPKRFKTIEEAFAHATDPEHRPAVSLYTCPLSTCHLAVKDRGLPKTQMQAHWNVHIQKNHVSSKEKLVLTPWICPPFRQLELFRRIYEQRWEDLMSDQNGNTDGSNTLEEDEDDAADADCEEIAERNGIFGLSQGDGAEITMERRAFNLQRNTELFEANKDKKFSLKGRGQTCRGPCPSDESRCVECQAALRMQQLLENCTNFSGSKLKNADLRALREEFEDFTNNEWKVPEDYGKAMARMDEVKTGKRPGTDIVVLDIEFSPISDQVWEIAVIEYLSGKVIINALVDHGDDIKHEIPNQRTPKILSEVSKSIHRKVYSQEGKLEKLGIDAIANKLRLAGISPNTTTRLLEARGHEDIWPGKGSCVPLLKQFRINTKRLKSKTKCFPLKLEILFAILYPNSKLVGHNHRAVVDCEQTRLVCQAFEDLSLPINKRSMDWKLSTGPRLKQMSIEDSFRGSEVSKKRAAAEEVDVMAGRSSKRVKEI
ncbi:unnamed protein product [Fusarium equiseti]|uniref:C2H2-type domain-containing protein n=1 Tax=Fusarium equiseti TaxID=61235 RepID=A0A8J2II71_FUSEQ|nr:unnamed protein product [Fusarium equiseti]